MILGGDSLSNQRPTDLSGKGYGDVMLSWRVQYLFRWYLEILFSDYSIDAFEREGSQTVEIEGE
jgi:hypothetical protein